MSKIDDYELNIRRQKLYSQYQQRHSNVDNMNSGNLDKSHLTFAAIGQIAGRSVTRSDSFNTKETKVYQSYLNSTLEDRLRSNYVNTIKKTEPNSSIISKVY